MKNVYYFILFCILICALLLSGFFVVQHQLEIHDFNNPIVNKLIEIQNPIGVKQIQVLSGDEFYLILEDDRRIHAFLEVKSTPDAKAKVLDFVNDCTNPRVILKQHNNGSWLVSMYVTTAGTAGERIEVSMAKWLREKRLAYDD